MTLEGYFQTPFYRLTLVTPFEGMRIHVFLKIVILLL